MKPNKKDNSGQKAIKREQSTDKFPASQFSKDHRKDAEKALTHEKGSDKKEQ